MSLEKPTYYELHKDEIKTKQKQYYQKNKEREKERSSKRYHKRSKEILERFVLLKQSNWEHYMFITCKCRAKRKGLDFTITESDIVIPEYCPYLGIKINKSLGNGPQLDSLPSLDRIDNTQGYVPGNVQVISRLANSMKSTADKKQLITFANSILRIYSEEGNGTK